MTEFVKRLSKYQKVIKATYSMTDHQYDVEMALFNLLSANGYRLSAVWDDYGQENFHKSFRQIDVTDSPNTDMAIYHLMFASKWWNRSDLMEYDLDSWES